MDGFLAVVISAFLTSMVALWLFVHLSVKRRFNALDDKLPKAYQAAFAVPTNDGQSPQLIALAIDLIRKEHVALPFDDLQASEKRIARFALAVETLPGWMVRYAMIRLRPAQRTLVHQLQQIKTSRPQKQQRHFGAIQKQLQLRALGKS